MGKKVNDFAAYAGALAANDYLYLARMGQPAGARDFKFSGLSFVTLTDAQALTNKTLTNPGITATGRFRHLTVPVGGAAYGATGTNTVLVAGTIYYADVYLPHSRTLTGIGILNGATVGTDNGAVGLYNSAGVLVANSALAGALSAGADAFQERAFTAPFAAIGPGRYWIAYQQNGATAKIRTVAASTFADVMAGSQVGVFGTLAAIAPAGNFTADKGPIGYVY